MKSLLFLLSQIIVISLWGASNEPNLTTPKQTFDSHFYYLKSEHFKPEISSKCFTFPEYYSQSQKNKIAIQLKEIYKGCGFYIQTDLIPNETDYLDSVKNKAFYVVIPQIPTIKIVKKDSSWVYALETVISIPEIHKTLYPFGTNRLLEILPKLGKTEILGLKQWQLISITLLFLLIFIFQRTVFYIFNKVHFTISNELTGEENESLTKKIASPIIWLLVFYILNIFVPVIQLPAKIGVFVLIGFKITLPILIVLTAYRFIDILAFFFKLKAEKTETKLDDQLVPIFRKTFKILVIVIGVLYVLQHFHVNITTLLAGLSIGGLAFALAAQDTIKNFFGSVMIFIDRPFQIGDWIVATGIDGNVEEVGFRATRVRTFANSLVYVPNGKLSDMVIENMGKRNYRRYKTFLAIKLETPPYLIELFVEGLRKIILSHPDVLKENYHVYLNAYNTHSLDILFYMFFDVPNWAEELKARHEINLEILKLAKKLQVEFAFPTQTLHINSFSPQNNIESKYPSESDAKDILNNFDITYPK